MNLQQVVDKIKEKPYMLRMSKRHISGWLGCSEEDAKAAKKIVRNEFRNIASSDTIKDVNMPRMLVLDIETAPIKAWVWSRWKNNIYPDQLLGDWFMLTWAAKWIGEDKVYADAITSHEVREENDKRICENLWPLLNEADFVITHNGDKFDLKRIKARFLVNGLRPVTPYKSIDTKKMIAGQLGFSSNKLDELAKVFNFDGKHETDFQLWADAMEGDEAAINRMDLYCRNDVVILEKVYLKVRPFIYNHPNITINMISTSPRCTSCGSDKIYPEGEYLTQVNSFITYRCEDCGAIAGRNRKSSINVKAKKNILVPVAK